MPTPPESRISIDKAITILSISPLAEDHILLEHIFANHDDGFHATGPRWKLATSFDLESATAALREQTVCIIMCETHLRRGTWHEILQHVSAFDDPPLLIVTSRLADERLWAEALHLGAFDVLAKPYDSEEVMRTVMLAWQHWQARHGLHRSRTKQRTHKASSSHADSG